jgi:hypothetical protein
MGPLTKRGPQLISGILERLPPIVTFSSSPRSILGQTPCFAPPGFLYNCWVHALRQWEKREIGLALFLAR